MSKEEVILIDACEMARILNITEEGLRQRIYRDKNIPHYKLIGVLKFNKQDVLSYFKRGAEINVE